MSKVQCIKCDICGKLAEEFSGYSLEIRRNLMPNSVGNVEQYDICEECKGTLGEWLRSKKPSDVPIVNTGGVI
jgi:hypothetical protein